MDLDFTQFSGRVKENLVTVLHVFLEAKSSG